MDSDSASYLDLAVATTGAEVFANSLAVRAADQLRKVEALEFVGRSAQYVQGARTGGANPVGVVEEQNTPRHAADHGAGGLKLSARRRR
jgi:hypothetical protein